MDALRCRLRLRAPSLHLQHQSDHHRLLPTSPTPLLTARMMALQLSAAYHLRFYESADFRLHTSTRGSADGHWSYIPLAPSPKTARLQCAARLPASPCAYPTQSLKPTYTLIYLASILQNQSAGLHVHRLRQKPPPWQTLMPHSTDESHKPCCTRGSLSTKQPERGRVLRSLDKICFPQDTNLPQPFRPVLSQPMADASPHTSQHNPLSSRRSSTASAWNAHPARRSANCIPWHVQHLPNPTIRATSSSTKPRHPSSDPLNGSSRADELQSLCRRPRT